MKLSLMGRVAMATLASLALGLGMSACGGGTIGFMWVLGDQYNQITGFKIDDFTGNLTQIIGSPFASNGTNPVSLVLKPGGRYVYVINQGTGGTRPTSTSTGKESSGGVAVYSVGGDGVLTFQQAYLTQGNSPVWAQFDSTGAYLYVLDKYSPDKAYIGSSLPDPGSITAFAVDSDTGRLTLVTNSQVLDKTTGNPTTFFNVGVGPIMMKSAGSCLFTLDAGDNSIYPYSLSTGGQLAITTPGSIPIQSGVTSVNGSGSTIYLTAASTNTILPYNIGGSCNLTSVTGGSVNNVSGTSNPTYSMVDNQGKYLYVLNQSTNITTGGTTTPFSSISAFVISPQLTAIPGSPYIVGANPVCMVEDPTGQYLYVSNRNDGTVTGLFLNATTGELSGLPRGSTFTASGLGNCLVVSPNVD